MRPAKLRIYALLALTLALGGCLAFAACGHEHSFGAWEVTKAPTCTEAGERVRTCTDCGEKETDAIPASGHDWFDVDILEEETCTESGAVLRQCYNCGSEQEFEIPPTGHSWLTIRTVEPTCTTDGTAVTKCSECGTVDKTETVAAFGHFWIKTSTIEQPTCTEVGQAEETCKRCKQTQRVEIPALGHVYAGEYTVDVRPSFEQDGSKSYHCTRCDAKNPDSIEVIPMLKADVPIDYEFRIRRNNGDLVVNRSMTVTVKNAAGDVVSTSKAGETATGIYTVSLLPQTYTVSLSGLPDGFSSETSYEVEAEDPYCTLWVTNSPIQKDAPAGTKYKVGDVMYDFTIKTSMGKTVSLSSLLEGKKAVVLNFFYVTCQWCRYEFPGLNAAYVKYQDDVSVLGIDGFKEPDSQINGLASEYALSFPLAADTSALNLASAFGLSAYPASVFIDAEGVIVRIDKSALVEDSGDGGYESERLYSNIFEGLIADSYWKNPAKAPASASLSAPLPALPAKRRAL